MLYSFQTSSTHHTKPETRASKFSNTQIHQNFISAQNRASSANHKPPSNSLVRFVQNYFKHIPVNIPELSKPFTICCNSINTHCHFCLEALQVEFCSTIQATLKQTKHWESFSGHQASSKEPQAPLEVVALSSSSSTETSIS